MMSAGIPGGTCPRGRMLRVAVAALLLAGCAPLKTTIFTDEQIRPTLKSLPNRPDYPLARTLTWKYYFTVDTPGSRMGWFFSDGNDGAQAMKGGEFYAAQPATSGTNMSDVYTRRAQEATKRGDHQTAQINHGLSATAAQTQIANQRIATGLALGNAIYDLGTALLGVLHAEIGTQAGRYVGSLSPRVISDQAPEGTVLEVFFRGNRLDHADVKPNVTAVRWETIATLKDAQGRLWRSNAFYTVYYAHSPASEPGPPQMPERFRGTNPVLMDVGNWVPEGGKDEYMPSIVEIAKMPLTPPGSLELSVTAGSAVAGLYEELELAKGKGRRSR